MAEHHATPSYACSAPEIVIGQIAANTQRIRVGSGGVGIDQRVHPGGNAGCEGGRRASRQRGQWPLQF